ncbi:MAG: hypothetical protein WCH21_02255 [Bacteroidota bacterium]
MFINILLSVLGFIGVVGVQQLIKIAGTIAEIKTQFEVLNTKHDYLENRVKDLEKN